MSARRSLRFVWLWLTVGFAGGTSVLLGPVRAVADHARDAGWPESAENAVVRAAMVALVLGSTAVAAWLARLAVPPAPAHVRLGVPAATGLAAAAALTLWMTPGLAVVDRTETTEPGSAFTFGPLPDEARMRELKDEGYTAVVSLLHPAVVPFEPRLIAEGRAAAAGAGIDWIHVPLLPWIGGNTAALDRLESLARQGRGRYYVHCYLGQDRVRLARRAVLRAEPALAVDHLGPHHALSAGVRFERGEVVRLDDGVFLTPWPTEDELLRFVVGGDARTVVSLLDPELPEDLPWVERQREALAAHGLRLVDLPLPGDPPDPGAAREAVRRVRAMPRPVVVQAFRSPGSGLSPPAEAFVAAWRETAPEAAPAGPVADAARPAEAASGAASSLEADPPAAGPLRRLVRRTVPGVRTVVLAGPPLALLTAMAAAFAGRLRAVRRVRAPYTRKVFHFLIFTTAAALHLAGGLPVVSLFGGIVTLAVLYAVARGDGFPFYEAMARPTDAPHRSLFVLIPLATTAVGGLASALLFGSFAYVGYLVAGWGDAVGEPVGTAFGRHRYRVPSLAGVAATRSVEGTAAVLAVGALAACLGLAAGGVPARSALVVGLACGGVGAAVEAFSHHGLDNLTIQIAAAGTACLLLAG